MKEGQKDTVTVTSDQWLVWKFEGECTLESYLAPPNDVNFPYNIEYAVLKKYNENMEDGTSTEACTCAYSALHLDPHLHLPHTHIHA